MPHKDYSYCTTIYKHQSFKHLGTFGVQIDFAEDMAIEALELGTRKFKNPSMDSQIITEWRNIAERLDCNKVSPNQRLASMEAIFNFTIQPEVK